MRITGVLRKCTDCHVAYRGSAHINSLVQLSCQMAVLVQFHYEITEEIHGKPKPVLPSRKERLEYSMPGMGAVATTFMAGVEPCEHQEAQPVGSMTQRRDSLGQAYRGRFRAVKDFVKLAKSG